MKNGNEFENKLINYFDNEITNKNKGIIIKSETPIKQTITKDGKRKIIYHRKALCDFVGLYKNKFLLIEAKDITGKMFQLDRLKKHQLDQLSKVEELGGKSFIIFNIKLKKEMWLISISSYINFIKTLNKKSFNLNDFNPNYFVVIKDIKTLKDNL